MRSPDYDFLDTRLSPDTAARCVLCATLGPDELGYAVRLEDSAEVWAHRSWQFAAAEEGEASDIGMQIRQALNTENTLRLPFERANLALFNTHATLVPRRFFDPGQLPDYFKLLLRPGHFSYAYEELSGGESFLVHALEPSVLSLCEHFFPSARPTHLAARMLAAWQYQARSDHADVFAHFRPRHVMVAGFDRGQLLFYNAFPFTAASDVLYFLLLAYEQMRLKPANVPLTMSGHLLRDSEIYKMLQRGFGDLRFNAPLVPPHFSQNGHEMPPPHFLFDLLSVQG